jgi:hypothetical protein
MIEHDKQHERQVLSRMFAVQKGGELKLEMELKVKMVLKFGRLIVNDCQDWIFTVLVTGNNFSCNFGCLPFDYHLFLQYCCLSQLGRIDYSAFLNKFCL